MKVQQGLCLGLLILAVGLQFSCGKASTARTAKIDMTGAEIIHDFEKSPRLREAFFRHLSASAAWRVTSQNKVIVAELRRWPTYASTQPSGGTPLDLRSPDHTLSVEIRFGHARPSRYPQPEALWKPGLDRCDVPLVEDDYSPGRFGSALTIEGSSSGQICVNIFESSTDLSRSRMQRVVDLVKSELSAVIQHSDTILDRGRVEKLLPDGSIERGKGPHGLTISRPSAMDGIYEVKGYINMGTPGYVTIRGVDANSGEEFGAEKNALRTVEYVGWSNDPDVQFCFENTVTLDGNGDERLIRIEVLFHPTGEGQQQPSIVLTESRRLKTWIR